MRTSVKRTRTRFLLVGAAMLVLSSSPQVAMSAEPALAIRLTNGHDWIYTLDEVERVSFGDDKLYVITVDSSDRYELESIARIEFLWDGLAGTDGPKDAPGLLEAMHLFQNHPNPFSPETWIAFELPQEGRAELRIYAVNGRLVRTLVDEKRPAGRHSVRWDGRDERGRPVANGVYFYSLTAAGVDESRKMILVK